MSHIGMRLTVAIATAVEGAARRLHNLRHGQGIPKAMQDALQSEEDEFRRVSNILDRWLHVAGDEMTSDAALIDMFDQVVPIKPKARPFVFDAPQLTEEECAIAAGVAERPKAKPLANNPFAVDRAKTGT